MGIITGFIEGIAVYDSAGNPQLLPFQDKIEGAKFNYASETLKVETFSSGGIKGNSAACPFREECSWELMSKDISWAFLQAVTATLDQASTIAYRTSDTVVLSTNDGTDSTIELGTAPAAGITVLVSDLNGTTYQADLSGSTVTLTGEGDLTGTKVTVSYGTTPGVSAREIDLGGSANKLTEIGLYGTFFSCPNSLIIVSNRVSIEANLNMEVGEGPAEAILKGTALRDSTGSFARIINQTPSLL